MEAHSAGGQAAPKRVLIVGAGAAGTAAAWSMSRPEHAGKFDVHVWEAASVNGGVATTTRLPNGAEINDGVQGGSVAYRNTLLIHKDLGFDPVPVHMKVSFGLKESSWNNHGADKETELVRRLRNDIAKFGRVLRTINKWEKVFILVPISRVLKMWNFSQDFGDKMIYPLTALFFGTGNQTPHVSSAIIARVFLDPDMRLFDYDNERLLSQTPEMFAFRKLGEIYAAFSDKCPGVTWCHNRPVQSIVRGPRGVQATDMKGTTESFDSLIMACDAETALKVLDDPSFMERKVLGNVKYYDDVTITHSDTEYMNKYYEVDPAMDDTYFIHSDEQDAKKLTMSFNLTNYQPQLRGSWSGDPIYQTIFLNKSQKSSWTIDEIDKDKVLLEKWWHQFAHTWKHFAFTVPFVRFLQSKKNTLYAGAYTLFNTHEVAVISGLAAAHRLGAQYPFKHDKLAYQQFELYMQVHHGGKI